MSHVRINLFGSFHMEKDGMSVDEQLSHSPKGILLMEYLILSPNQTADAKTLMRVLWPEETSARPESALKTLVSRQRALLRTISEELSDCLTTIRGGYRWISEPGVTVDVLLFEQLLAPYQQNDAPAPSDEVMTQILSLYQGRLLEGDRRLTWTSGKRERLHQMFLQAVDARLRHLKQTGHVHRYVALVRQAIDADPTNEALQQRLIEGLNSTERTTDAAQQAELTSRISEFAMEEQLRDYRIRIQQAVRTVENDLSALREELLSEEDNGRAILCDSRVFKALFRMQRHSMERSGGQAVLGLLTLTELERGSVRHDASMNGLVKIILLNLRSSDVITRINDSTVAVLLPNADVEAGNIVMERLKRLFYLQFPSTGRTISTAVTVIGGGRKKGQA